MTGIVAYCDGGASPNPGNAGSGCHGYIYRLPESEKDRTTKHLNFILTTTGYVAKKDFDDKKHQAVVVIKFFDLIKPLGFGSNNNAEIQAVSTLLNEDFSTEADRIHVICDSMLVVNGVNSWIPNWIKNNWIKPDGKQVANKEDWQELNHCITKAKERSEFTLVWSRGHDGEPGNERADKLATIARNLSRSVDHYAAHELPTRVYLEDPKEREGWLPDPHPFISLKRVYFNTSAELNQPGTYYQTDGSGSNFVVGKRSSEAAFSVISLDNPDPIVEAVIQAATERERQTNTVVFMKLDRFKERDVLEFVNRYGKDALEADRRNANINFLDRKPIVNEVKPGELPLRSFDVLAHLEEMLFEFKNNYLTNGEFFPHKPQYALTTVTEEFYEFKTKKSRNVEIEVKELKKSIGVGIKDIRIPCQIPDGKKVNKFNFLLRFGEDVPQRNTFKSIESIDPEIFILSWKESPQSIRYATVIKTEDAVGIWSNYFANTVLLQRRG